jgi:transcriptional regulator with GAF, ATPase, and Fis domain
MIMLDIRRIDDALYYLESSIDEVNRKHNEWERINGKLTLSLVCYLKNDMGRAISNLREFLELSRHVHVNVRPYPYLLELCWAMDEGKFPRLGGLSFQEELRRMIGGKNIFMKGVAYRYQALLLKREGHFHNNIIKSLNLSMRWLEESGHQIELANSQIELARQYLLLGNSGGAKEIAMRAFETIAPLNEALFPDDLKSLIKGPIHVENLMKDIMKLSQEVITIRDNKDLVQHILSTVNRITGAERGAIFLLDRSTKTPKLNLRASKNLTSDQVTDQSFTSSLKMVKEVALSGKGLILGSNQAGKSDSFSGGAIRSRICVPMIFGNKVVGVLYHDNRLLSSAFRESDLEFLNYFAAQAAIALDNVRAYEEIQQLNQKLKEEKSYYEEQHLHSLHFEEIVGESPPIMKVLDRVGQVAKTETNVLILGETGVGKELVAKALHRHSCRCNRPFIRVFCSAIPDNLIPSELFGHEKGAFTGAVSRTIGRFELADGGTIFLDEIGDLPLDVQVRLLRVLQNKEFERIGSSETLRSDFRLVTATNHDLEQAIKAGRFRSDLYYRLNVFPIFVPPLRERKEDIPLLANYFLKSYATKMGKTFQGIPKSEMERLIEYDWPGNVRELENIIERGTILSSGLLFKVPELWSNHPEIPHLQEDITLRGNERRHILWALKKTGWKVRGQKGAAELLKIHPSTLAFRMKKLGIQRPPKYPTSGRNAKREWEHGVNSLSRKEEGIRGLQA